MEQILSFAELFLIWILLAVMLAVYLLLMVRLFQILKVRVEKLHTLELVNDGNLPSVYQLSVSSPEPRLEFKLFHNGRPLMKVPEPPKREIVSQLETPPQQQLQAAAKPSKKTPKKPAAAPSQDKSAISQASQKGQAASAKLGIVSGFLGTLGSLLPGKLGRQLKNQGASVREAQVKTLKTVQAPKQIQRKTDALQSQSGRLGVNLPQGAQSPGAEQMQTPVTEPGSSAVVQTLPTRPAQPVGASIAPQVYQVQTRELVPGAKLSLVLKIRSKDKRYPSGSFAYSIQSKQVPSTPIKIEPPLLTKQGTVYFEHIAAWRYGLPVFAMIAVVALTLLATFYYLLLI